MTVEKIVVTLADGLPPGLAINAGALLGITLGQLFPDLVGPDVLDASGTAHPGISMLNLPCLRASTERLSELAGKARTDEQVTVIDLTRTAQQARTYVEYTERMARLATERHQLIGLALAGPETTLTSLTGDLPLCR
jgi:hypothetical protein